MTEIDLAPYVTWLPAHLKGAFADFAKKHPDVEVSCIALYVTPYGGSAWINYDTQEHADAWVEKYKNNESYVRKDEAGAFSPHPNDFAYGQAGDFEFPSFPNLYEATEPIRFRDATGKTYDSDTADENIGRIMLDFLRNVLQSFDEFGSLKRSKVFRMGISIHNTDCDAFWIHKAG
jgi:hypothetical protein